MKKQILNAINSATQEQLVELNNIYCQSCNINGEIYSNDESFFEMFYSKSGDSLKFAQDAFYGDYNYFHIWVTFDGYENLKSYANISTEQLCELPDVISEYIDENFNNFKQLDIFKF